MQTETIPLLDDDTARKIRIARVLLERAQDDLEEIERNTDGALRDSLSGVFMNLSLGIEELP